jgi:hypothetical protein
MNYKIYKTLFNCDKTAHIFKCVSANDYGFSDLISISNAYYRYYNALLNFPHLL